MDEEDLQEAEQSRTLQTSEEFAGFGTQQDPKRRSAAIELFRPSEQTRGAKLLMRMGWKEGQGIGPRVRRAANLQDGSDTAGDQHLFAPSDIEIVSYFRKSDRKGLGYDGELQETPPIVERSSKQASRAATSAESSDEENSAPRLFKGKKIAKPKPKTGFGVGVLNDDDDDDDDDDPYSMGPKISYNRVIGGDKKPKGKPKSIIGTANPMLKHKPTFVSKKLGSVKGILRKCHDGRLPPDGFTLADELDAFGTMSINAEKYRPPQVPADWKSSVSSDTATPDATFTSTADAARASSMTAKSRAALLGESSLPGKSIFDFMTPSARDRLAAASGRDNLPPAKGEHGPSGYEGQGARANPVLDLVPQLEKEVALQALSRGANGWMPYAEDEGKRSRYRAYLEIQAGLVQSKGGSEIPPKADGMKQDDWVIEMQEFARAAQVFKPISGLMASRFTSSSSVPQGQNGEASDSLLSKPAAKPEDPAEAAAKLGMFGPLTRSFSNFYPSRLVSKRFSLPPPEHVNQPTSASSSHGPSHPMPDASTTQPTEFGSADVQRAPSTTLPRPHEATSETKQPAPDGHASRAFNVDPGQNEALEQERPGMAVFKAIFGSDDEDD